MSLPKNRQQRKTNVVVPVRRTKGARCAVITGVGRSAVAVVAIDGEEALPIVTRFFRPASRLAFKPGQIRYGAWVGNAEQDLAAESVIVTPLIDGSVEIHCHGGPAAQSRIVDDLRAAGVTPVSGQAWQESRCSLLIGEASKVLSQCLTVRTAGIAMDQVRGALQDWTLDSLRKLISTLAHDRESSMCGRVVEAIHREAATILRVAPLGLHLARPFRVVLVGPPNVGKSSLLNALVGYDRSITFDDAGTTRDVLHAETVIDGWPVRLSDTAGIRDSAEPIERQGVERARGEAEGADLLLLVAEPARIGSDSFERLYPQLVQAAEGVPVLRLLNKSDLWQPRSSPGDGGGDFDLLTCALTGNGINELLQSISGRLAQNVPVAGSPVPVTPRQVKELERVLATETPRPLADALHSLLGTEDVLEDS